MKRILRDMIKDCFELDELMEEMKSIICDSIDYQQIAAQILDDIDIEETALEIAIDKLEDAPF